MIGIFVNHDRIRVPIPVGHIRIVERIDAEVCVIKPEPRAIAALQVEYVAGAKAERKASVCVGVVEVIVAFVYVTVIMTEPLAIRMDMRCVRVPGDIAIIPLLSLVLLRCFALLRGCPLLRSRPLLGRLPLWAVGRYVAAANMVTVLLFLTTVVVLFAITTMFLSVRWNQQD